MVLMIRGDRGCRGGGGGGGGGGRWRWRGVNEEETDFRSWCR